MRHINPPITSCTAAGAIHQVGSAEVLDFAMGFGVPCVSSPYKTMVKHVTRTLVLTPVKNPESALSSCIPGSCISSWASSTLSCGIKYVRVLGKRGLGFRLIRVLSLKIWSLGGIRGSPLGLYKGCNNARKLRITDSTAKP